MWSEKHIATEERGRQYFLERTDINEDHANNVKYLTVKKKFSLSGCHHVRFASYFH
jgi:hypothetical protein